MLCTYMLVPELVAVGVEWYGEQTGVLNKQLSIVSVAKRKNIEPHVGSIYLSIYFISKNYMKFARLSSSITVWAAPF